LPWSAIRRQGARRRPLRGLREMNRMTDRLDLEGPHADAPLTSSVRRFGPYVLATATGGADGITAFDACGPVGLVLSRPCDRGPDAPYAVHIGPLGVIAPSLAPPLDLRVVGVDAATAPAWLRGLPRALMVPEASGFGRLIANFVVAASDLAGTDAECAVDAALALCEQATGLGDPSCEPDVRRSAIDYIEAHLLDPALGVDRLVQALGSSRAAIYRSFPSAGGISAFIRARRLERAREALARRTGSRPTVAEIARAHGFASESHFSRAFREAFGQAPAAAAKAQDGD
jgi:AraC-like DNA-binding protein